MDVLFSIVLPLVPSAQKLAIPVLIVSARTRVLLRSLTEGKGDKFYTIADDDAIENAGLLPGETEPDFDDDSDDENIPVRLLDKFTIYDWDTLRLVPIADLLDLGPAHAMALLVLLNLGQTM